jgi:hypothetical protein
LHKPPGFAYQVGKERNGTERRASPFRETGAVVAASITSELAVLAIFAIVRWLRPSVPPDVGALIRHGAAYLHGHYGKVAIWAAGMLIAAVLLAYAMTLPRVRRCKLIPKIFSTYPHESAVSAWWLIFEEWPYERDVEICCILNDGSAIRGQFKSFNNSADDSPDRDLILVAPIRYRPPGSAHMDDYPAGVACVAARNIAVLFAGYDGEPQINRQRRRKHSVASSSPPPVPEMSSSPPSAPEMPGVQADPPVPLTGLSVPVPSAGVPSASDL